MIVVSELERLQTNFVALEMENQFFLEDLQKVTMENNMSLNNVMTREAMSEFLDDRFENIEHVSSHEYFLCEQTTKKLYHACALTRLSSSLLILNLQNQFGWCNVSIMALL